VLGGARLDLGERGQLRRQRDGHDEGGVGLGLAAASYPRLHAAVEAEGLLLGDRRDEAVGARLRGVVGVEKGIADRLSANAFQAQTRKQRVASSSSCPGETSARRASACANRS